MTKIVSLQAALESEGAGAWAYAANPSNHTEGGPAPERCGFVLQKTTKGLWSIAVRGFNNGEALPGQVTAHGGFAASYEGELYGIFGNADMAYPLHPLPDEQVERYSETMCQLAPPPPRSVLEILELGHSGVWELDTMSARYNEYEPRHRLTYKDPEHIGFATKYGGATTFSSVGEARLIQKGPKFEVRLYETGIDPLHGKKLLGACSLLDRVNPGKHPILTRRVTPPA